MRDIGEMTRQELWHLEHLRTVSTKLTLPQYQTFVDDCFLNRITPYAGLKLLILSSDAEMLYRLGIR